MTFAAPDHNSPLLDHPALDASPTNNTSRRTALKGAFGMAGLAGLTTLGAANASAGSRLEGKMFFTFSAKYGSRYKLGTAGPTTFDCAGIVKYAAARAGVSGVPTWTEWQIKRFSRIKAVSGKTYLSNVARYAQNYDLIYYFDRHGVSQHVGMLVRDVSGGTKLFSARSSSGRLDMTGVANFPYSRAQVYRIS